MDRKEAWVRFACVALSAAILKPSDCGALITAKTAADKMLAEYDKRFGGEDA